MSKKGFTLVELMVVILIVAILAAVAIPIMRGRVDSAKWSEGKAMMGTIATGIRAYCAEVDKNIADLSELSPEINQDLFWASLGFRDGDLDGTYFEESNFKISGSYIVQDNLLNFIIECTKGVASGINNPSKIELNQDGEFSVTGP
jgi:prepilin-type N-terminal cleavage/methylation domain-containing protein